MYVSHPALVERLNVMDVAFNVIPSTVVGTVLPTSGTTVPVLGPPCSGSYHINERFHSRDLKAEALHRELLLLVYMVLCTVKSTSVDRK